MKKEETSAPRKISVLYPLQSIVDPTSYKDKAIRVAAYCRVSTGSDIQLVSYRAQVKYYESYIRERPDYIFAGIYADEGLSGTDLTKRDEFNQMMQDARDSKFDLIITKSLSRFGRNTLDCLNSLRELKSLGIDVLFESENIRLLGSSSELLISLMSAFHQAESENLSENVKWGIRKKYAKGNIRSIPSGKFLGYDKDKHGDLVINDDQAVLVRRIYREFLEGYSPYLIAKRFTEENLSMAYGGKQWCPSHISKVLLNEKFKGDTMFQKTFNTCYLTKKRAKNRGEIHKYYLEDSHPAIIDKETWELVQLEFKRQDEFLKAHHLQQYRRDETNPFSNKIICGTCGSTYGRYKSNRVGEDYRPYLRCISFNVKKWTAIEGRSFTPKPHHRKSMEAYNIKRRKDPLPRQMYCTDVQIDVDTPETAFITAWNYLVENKANFEGDWKNIMEFGDKLEAYRASELMRLLEEVGIIEEVTYDLVIRTLSHMEVGVDSEMKVIFLCGTELVIETE
jgi:DNA invertase Pin-like site-specific DNA recombinase